PTPEDVDACRRAVPAPSGLVIMELGHEGEAIRPWEPVWATLEVRDQWGGYMPGDHETVVRASVAPGGSGGATVVEGARTNTSRSGVVHFSHLAFTEAGNLTVRFSIGDITLASARVVVVETQEGLLARNCRGVFSLLECPVAMGIEGGPNSSPGTVHLTLPSLTESVSVVEGDVAWLVFACMGFFEQRGVPVAIFTGKGVGEKARRTGVVAQLWYHPGMEALETGSGLPSCSQTPRERLGVSSGAGVREVRRAYYRLSLMWHPDRWVRHAMHLEQAQEMFELVSEAY
ncbi:unnamed protein product, partial [Discosporangium mesarthrocarpum]